MNRKDSSDSVIPGLTRNPAVRDWIPAFAGMTWLSIVFFMTAYSVNLLFLFVFFVVKRLFLG